MSLIKESINNHKLKDYIYEVDGVYFLIDPSWNRISFSISGGADSALLSYLICSKIVELNLKIDIHIISNVRMWKTRPWQRYNSLDVFKWLQNKFTTLNFYRHENFIAPEIEFGNIGATIKDRNGRMKSGDQITTRSYAEYVCLTNNIDAWFAGITKNPPVEVADDGMADRNVGELIDLNTVLENYGGLWFCHPLKYITKEWVLNQYVKHGILDLFNLTRSCEGDRNNCPEVFNNLDYTNYVPGTEVPECGQCFWCKERNWAKNLNNV
jgi:hypothetical protein